MMGKRPGIARHLRRVRRQQDGVCVVRRGTRFYTLFRRRAPSDRTLDTYCDTKYTPREDLMQSTFTPPTSLKTGYKTSLTIIDIIRLTREITDLPDAIRDRLHAADASPEERLWLQEMERLRQMIVSIDDVPGTEGLFRGLPYTARSAL